MEFGQGHVLATLGLVLAAALFAGMFADYFRIPKVTAYLLVGILLGPCGLDLLVRGHVETLHPVTQLAMALVLFELGCNFPLTHGRRFLRRVLRLSMWELGATFLFVAVGLFACGEPPAVALILGSLALATAPATTILVLKETESQGPLTDRAGALVILNNFAAILLFEAVFLGIHLWQDQAETTLQVQVALLIGDLGGSILLGIAIGVIVSYSCGLVTPKRWPVLLIAAFASLLGVDEALGIPYMLSFLAMGLTVAITSDAAGKIVDALDRLTVFLCVVFFVIHGAELELSAFVEAGFVGGAYIVFRFAGKYVGIRTAARFSGEPTAIGKWLGSSLIAQAGAAIALATIAARRDPELGQHIQTIILGTVVFFEIVGPLMIRHAVLQAGEVPLARAVHHTNSTPLEEMKRVYTCLMVGVGRNPLSQRSPDDLSVRDFVRRSVPVLRESNNFAQVISIIQHTHEETYPVVDDELRVVGIIRYADISRVLFDRDVTSLINASDLARPVNTSLRTDDPLSKSLDFFRRSRNDSVPVIDSEPPHRLVGMIRRRDVTAYLAQGHEMTDEPGAE